jgi:hypothetical protein
MEFFFPIFDVYGQKRLEHGSTNGGLGSRVSGGKVSKKISPFHKQWHHNVQQEGHLKWWEVQKQMSNKWYFISLLGRNKGNLNDNNKKKWRK